LVRLCGIKSLVFVEAPAVSTIVENRLRDAASFDVNENGKTVHQNSNWSRRRYSKSQEPNLETFHMGDIAISY